MQVPEQAIQDGRVVLNISPSATRSLHMDNDAVSFQARFGGVARELWLPMAAILAIYARENGQGMMFAELADGSDDDQPPPDKPDKPGTKPDGPVLRVIK